MQQKYTALQTLMTLKSLAFWKILIYISYALFVLCLHDFEDALHCLLSNYSKSIPMSSPTR